MSPPPDKAPMSLADYPVRSTEKLRYADTDRQGHVNNAVFATLFESGRVAFFYAPERPLLPTAGAQVVIANLNIDFIAELNWPGEVIVATAVEGVGRSSFRLAQALFRDGDCVARSRSVLVLMDEATRTSTPLPEGLRAALLAMRQQP